MTGNKTAQPYATIPVSNGVKIVFWENEREGRNGNYKQLSPSISKSYQDKEQKWHSQSVNMNMNDLFRVFAMASAVKELEDKFKSEQKSADVDVDPER
jgi:hypothetical protein